MQPWGEFLDTEWFYIAQSTPTPVETWAADPWRARARADIVMVPRDIIDRIAQPERLRYCETTDRDVTMSIAASLEAEGLQHPFELVCDRRGRIILRDGHHRLLTLRRWEHFAMIPCLITWSDGVAVAGSGDLAIDGLLVELLHRSSTA